VVDMRASLKRLVRRTSLNVTAMWLVWCIVAVTQVRSEPQAPTAGPFSWNYKYEVVSIKPRGIQPSTGLWGGYVYDQSPNSLRVEHATLIALVQGAYPADRDDPGFADNKIVGAPDWARSEWFGIDAKMDPFVADQLAKLSPVRQRYARALMLQAILADYFKFAVHVENREASVYFLEVAKKGPKLKQAMPNERYPLGPDGVAGPGGPWQTGWVVMYPHTGDGSSKYRGLGAPVDRLALLLSARVHRTVVNRTGLPGKYDFELQFLGTDDSEIGTGASWPPLFTAIQTQLGLKLESGKAPVPVLVIDHAERPAPN